MRLSATNPPARTSRATDQAPRLSDRVPRPERAPPPDRAPGPELVPLHQAVVLAPPPSTLAGRFRRPTNCVTDKQYCGRFSSSGSLAMPAAIFLASSLVISRAAARRPGSFSKWTYATGKFVGVADDEARVIGFIERPWRWGGTSCATNDQARQIDQPQVQPIGRRFERRCFIGRFYGGEEHSWRVPADGQGCENRRA